MAEGVVLKWFSDYRINIQGHTECRERDNSTETDKGSISSTSWGILCLSIWLKVKKSSHLVGLWSSISGLWQSYCELWRWKVMWCNVFWRGSFSSFYDVICQCAHLICVLIWNCLHCFHCIIAKPLLILAVQLNKQYILQSNENYPMVFIKSEVTI